MKHFFSKRFAPPLMQHGYNNHIEQYRGLCALLVFITHATAHEELLTNNFHWPKFVHYLGAGYLSVIVFFCLSGYVIAISNDDKYLDIKFYLKKRFVRLYPAYFVAIVLCVFIAKHVDIYVLIGNLFFLQNNAPYFFGKIPVFVNFVTWSLNYEVLYYFFFILLFFLRPKVWQLLLIMLLFSLIMINTKNSTLFLTQYLNGYYFWILGLLFGWKIIQSKIQHHTFVPLLSMLFLQLCQNYLGIGVIVLHVLGVHSNTNFNWIFDIPFCIMIMSVLTNTSNAFLKLNNLVCYTLPSTVFTYLILHHRLLENERWIMCFVFWICSLLLYNERKISAFILDKLSVIGKISYSLYLLHIPVALLIKKTIFINYRPTEIAVKYTLWIVVTFGLSVFLDMVYQPAIKKYLS